VNEKGDETWRAMDAAGIVLAAPVTAEPRLRPAPTEELGAPEGVSE